MTTNMTNMTTINTNNETTNMTNINTNTTPRRPTALAPIYRDTTALRLFAARIAPTHPDRFTYVSGNRFVYTSGNQFIYAAAPAARMHEHDVNCRRAIHTHGQDLARAICTGASMAHLTEIPTTDTHWNRLMTLIERTNIYRGTQCLDHIVACIHCGTLFTEDDGFTQWDGEPLCEDCAGDRDRYVVTDEGLVPRQDAIQIATSIHRDHMWRWNITHAFWARENTRDVERACEVSFFFHETTCDHITAECALENGFEERGGVWRDEDEIREMEEDDELEELEIHEIEGGDDLEEGVYSYHAHPLRRNESYWAEKSQRHDPALGVELEIFARANVPAALADAGLNWIVEYDGSLNPVYGREIVSPPRLLSYWRDLTPRLCDALVDAADASGYDAPDADRRDYGIHVSLHRRHLSRLQEHRLIQFCSGVENTHFIRAIAQRHDIYEADLSIGGLSLEKSDRSPRRFGYRVECPKQDRALTTTKRQPINLKTNLAEFRIFHSTLNPAAFVKNLEFVHALVAWTQPVQCTGKSVFYGDFVRWVAGRSKDYPALYEFLMRDDYGVKRGQRVQNTWREYMK